MKILIDFDGTCVKHNFPEIGEDIGAVPVLKALVLKGHKLILFTMRSSRMNFTGKGLLPSTSLDDAKQWFSNHGIPLYGVQKDPNQNLWTDSPKAFGELIIDDTNLGIPLKKDPDTKRHYVDWVKTYELLVEQGIL